MFANVFYPPRPIGNLERRHRKRKIPLTIDSSYDVCVIGPGIVAWELCEGGAEVFKLVVAGNG
jgi:hypothetical protein